MHWVEFLNTIILTNKYVPHGRSLACGVILILSVQTGVWYGLFNHSEAGAESDQGKTV